ncbi:MAG TPA: IS630 family transposase [Cyanobacteria bacterium UBA11049]|nr:IS630 family transposase [Cyanobacteria bacterium UBA11049]
MLTLQINEADLAVLTYEKYLYPCLLVQKRLEVIHLRALTELTNQQIAKLAGVHPDTVTDYVRCYNAKGLDGLKAVGYRGTNSSLDEHKSSLQASFLEQPPISSNQAVARIKALTGIVRSPTQVRQWMKKIGMKYQKTGQVPAKADPVKQQEWVTDTLTPLIQQVKEGKAHLLFMDSAHLVMGVFLCCLWSFSRVFIQSASARKRLNVLGAVDAVSKQITFLTITTYITAQTVVDFLGQLREKYPTLPLYIVLDNARYQHCQLVKQTAQLLAIHLLFLPAYSPNLNIIERLWKWLKKTCLYTRFYEAALPIRWVLLRDPEGKLKTMALLCTDESFASLKIVSLFVRR